jgi:glutaredoxin-like protein NrdH
MQNRYAAGPDEITLYALSTCIWCRKTRRFLDSLGISYRLIEVDLLAGEDQKEAYAEVSRWSSTGSFPVLVIRRRTVIQGYKEEKILKELGL